MIMDSNTFAESDLSLKSRSFLHRVNDQVRKRQYQSWTDASQDSDQTLFDMENVEIFYITSICIHGWRITLDNLHSFTNTEDLEMKQMFDIYEKLISEQSDEICGVNTTNWEDSSWKHFIFGQWWRSHQSLAHNDLRIPRFCFVLERCTRSPQTHKTELWTQLMVSRWNSSGIFPRIHHIADLQQSPRVPDRKMSDQPEEVKGTFLHVDVQRHLMEISRQWTGMRI